MIPLTRLDGREVVVNADHILSAESTPDTVVVLTSGLHLMVREAVAEVVDRMAAWQQRVRCPEHPGCALPFARGLTVLD